MSDDEQTPPTEPIQPTEPTGEAATPTEPIQPVPSAGGEIAAKSGIPEDAQEPVPATSNEPIELASKSRKGVAILLAALLVVVVGTGAWALFAFAGSSDVLATKAPADSLAFATIYLDPAAGQKANLANIASQFPGGSEATEGATSILKDGASELGLDWDADVKPWLGSQMAVAVPSFGDGEPEPVFLIDTTDASKAEASLQKIRASSGFEGLEWRAADASGVAISVGTTMGLPDPVMTYAVTDDTVIISPSLEATKQVIATIQGETENLTSSADYTDTMSSLPSDSLGQVYVNMPALFKLSELAMAGDMGLPGGPNPLDQFKAYRGMGMGIAAESDGIAMEFTVLTDPDMLTAAQKQAASVPPHKNAALQYASEDSYGIFSMTNLDGTLQALTQIATGSVSGDGGTETGSPVDAILKQITDATSGDAAISVSPGIAPEKPGGMLMIATDDQAAMESLLQQLTTLITATMPTDPVTGGGNWTEEDHDGTTLHTLGGLGGELADSGIAPTWAVTSDMALIGTTPAEVSASLDAKSSGTTIEQQPNFQSAIAHADEMNSGMLYIDMKSITDLVADSMTDTTDAVSFRTVVAPVKAVMMTSTTEEERSTATVFVLIEE